MSVSQPHAPLSRAGIAREAFSAAQEITNDWHRSRAVRQLAALLPPDCAALAVALARAMRSPTLRARTLMAAALAAPEAERPALLAEAAQAIDAITPAAERAGPRSILAQRLSGTAATEAALAAQTEAAGLEEESERGWTLVDLLPLLPEAARLTVLEQLRAIHDPCTRAMTLGYAVEYLPEDQQAEVREEALRVARAIREPEARGRALAELTATLPADERSAVAEAALAAATEHNEALFWARVVQRTAAHLSLEAREAAYANALVLPTAETCAEALGPLAVVTPLSERAPRLAEVLRIAATIADDWGRAFAISRVAGALTPELFDAALDAARAIGDPWARSDLLVDLTAAMPPELVERTLREALEAARACVAAWPRARALTGVAGKCAD
jgi:hypothetical protein